MKYTNKVNDVISSITGMEGPYVNLIVILFYYLLLLKFLKGYLIFCLLRLLKRIRVGLILEKRLVLLVMFF